MQRLSFHSPSSVKEACDLLAEHPHDTRVLAGGQSLIQMLKQRIVSASRIVDISGINELEQIRLTESHLWVGASVTYADVSSRDAVQTSLPVLPDMISTIGDTQVRNRGTLVGGIAHADPQGDPPVLATALNATVRVSGPDEERVVPAREFYRGLFDTALSEDELIVEVGFPLLDERTTAAFQSFTPRKGDYAVASAVPVVTINGAGDIADASVTVGAVGDVPQVVDAASDALVGAAVDDLSPDDVGRLVAGEATVVGSEEWSEGYRRRLLESVVSDALREVGVGSS